MDDPTELFETHRGLLFAVVYRMLSSVAEAEDVVQDAWLRWSATDRGDVADPRAYLVRIATNLAINRLTSARARRESYVGPWLPEPLLTEPDAAERVELAESVSLAMLVVLETLSPLERAVFLLHDVFGFPHPDIARMLDRSPSAVRQLAHRAREHVQARRPRFDTDTAERRRITGEFLDACLSGDVDRLMGLLAPDVTLWTDAGGKRRAALRPIHGAAKVTRFVLGVVDTIRDSEVRFVEVNGAPGIVIAEPGGTGRSVLVPEVADGRMIELRVVMNPDKLASID